MNLRPFAGLLPILPILAGCGAGGSGGGGNEAQGGLGFQDTSYSSVLRHPEWEETVQGFARQLSDQVAADSVGGVEAGIVLNGELVWHQAFGWSRRDEATPLVPGAAFRTGSISRTVTAVLLLRLVDRGIVALDDPVEPYLPELAEARSGASYLPRVTFRHLASHTSGLARNYQEGQAGPLEDWKERVVASFGNLAFDTLPGFRYQDSPIGFGALGLALERAAEIPFVELVRTGGFGPPPSWTRRGVRSVLLKSWILLSPWVWPCIQTRMGAPCSTWVGSSGATRHTWPWTRRPASG